MNAFPDTTFLCALYRSQINSIKADAFLHASPSGLPISSLVLLEFRQSVRLQMRLYIHDRSKGFTQEEGWKMLNDLQMDLNAGLWTPVPIDWAAVHQRAEALSHAHTMKERHRFADILHVATALQLGATDFLTFDTKQRSLAEAEGLVVPL